MSFINPYRFAVAGAAVELAGTDVDTQAPNSSSVNFSLEFTNTGGSDRLLVAFVSLVNNDVPGINTVTYDGEPGTILTQKSTDGGEGLRSGIIYWKDSELPGSSGDKTLYINSTEGWIRPAVAIVFELNNVDQDNPFSTPPSWTSVLDTGSGNTHTSTLNGESDQFVLSCVSCADASTFGSNICSPSSNLTEAHEAQRYNNGGAKLAAGHDDACGSASEGYAWTVTPGFTTDSLATIAVALNAA
ncbi:MAG: hypothetical protein GY746_07425 [Gammaproteobacteria bacterium]|nr:hypothetical protein [Gammaproteobacteria bacterium]